MSENEITEQTMELLTIPSEHVEMGRPANIIEEEVLWGEDIRPNMIVLICDPLFRENQERVRKAEPHELSYIKPRYDEANRWCKVLRVRPISHDIIQFIGLYADGTIRTRTMNVTHAWIVKKASI